MRNTSTIPWNIFIYGHSLGGSSFEQLMSLDTTIVSLFLNLWLNKGYFDSSWLLSLWFGFGLNFLHLIRIPHISKRAVLPLPSNEIILPLSLKPYSFLKVCGWYVFGIKTRGENGINLMFPGIQHPFQEIFFHCFSGCFCIHMWYS